MARSIEERLASIETNMVTKDDLREELKKYPTKDDLREELRKYATKDDLRAELQKYATKEDLRTELQKYATKEDLRTELQKYATKEDLYGVKSDLEQRLHQLDQKFTDVAEFLNEKIDNTAVELRRHMSVMFENFEARMVTLVRGIDVRDRVARLEERMDAVERRLPPER